tara:strand:- start:6696 stop:7457 length:762 start_codon:yes stop_codon:yes gene_type:complete
MKVKIIPILTDNYSYLIIDKENKFCSAIDPASPEEIIPFIEKENLILKNILNTHYHNDHTGGNLHLKKIYKCKIYGPDGEKDKIPGIDVALKENDILKINNYSAKIFETPGHTAGHIIYWFKKEKKVFTGDTLFVLGCGKLFEGTPKVMWNSLLKIRNLPKETKIYCGHEYSKSNADFALSIEKNNNKLIKRSEEINKLLNENSFTVPTTIKNEIESNPFLRADIENVKKNIEMQNSSPEEIFYEIRKRKDNF